MPPIPAHPEIGSDEIHIWELSLQEHRIENLSFLSADEIERASRFHSQTDRSNYVTARTLLRSILASYLNIPPGEIQFRYSAFGKPYLELDNQLQFNISHSADSLAIALTKEFRIGVDVELIDDDHIIEDEARRILSKKEWRVFEALNEQQKRIAFYKYWSMKEAIVKAADRGLSIEVNTVEVAFGSQMDATLIDFGGNAETARWSLYDLDLRAGYAAAVAAEGKGHKLKIHSFKR